MRLIFYRIGQIRFAMDSPPMTDTGPGKARLLRIRAQRARVAGPDTKETWYVAGVKFTPVAFIGPGGALFSTQLASGVSSSN